MPQSFGPIRGAVALVAGRYELLRELSASAEFQEWESFDTALERVVIMRLAPHEASPHSAVSEAFWRAARTAARARATAGERVLDAGTDPETGRAFVICEWPQREDTHPMPVPLPAPAASPSRLEQPGRPSRRRLALAVASVGLVAIVAVIGVSMVNAPSTIAPKAFSLPPAVAATTAPTPVSTQAPAKPTATARPAATATAVTVAGVPRRIVNTDGRGVALRDGPNGNRLPGKGYDEGVTVTAFESSGGWTRIRGADGREGWVLSVTLAP